MHQINRTCCDFQNSIVTTGLKTEVSFIPQSARSQSASLCVLTLETVSYANRLAKQSVKVYRDCIIMHTAGMKERTHLYSMQAVRELHGTWVVLHGLFC